jgi:hypothetical protein
VNVNDVVQIKIEEAARRIEAARRRRAELDAARRAGLRQRHAQKLRNLDETPSLTRSRNAPAEQPAGTPAAGNAAPPGTAGCSPRPEDAYGGGSFQAAGTPAAMTNHEGETP